MIRNKTRALTLIELVVVAAIVAVLSTAATTAFLRSFQDRSLDHYLKELTSYFRFVQFKAIEEGRVHKLVFDEESGKLSSFVQDPFGLEFSELKDLFSKRFRKDKRFFVRPERGNEVYFFPDGVIEKSKLRVMDEKGELAVIEIKNRIGAFQVTVHD